MSKHKKRELIDKLIKAGTSEQRAFVIVTQLAAKQFPRKLTVNQAIAVGWL